MKRFLYRGINKEEKLLGCILVPKSQETFKAHPRLPLPLSFNLGEYTKYAIRDHQNKDDLGIETSGVSTTFQEDIAKKYAGEGIIVKIDRFLLEKFGIREYIVKTEGYLPINLEDDEVILVNEDLTKFPREIIVETIKIKEKGPK